MVGDGGNIYQVETSMKMSKDKMPAPKRKMGGKQDMKGKKGKIQSPDGLMQDRMMGGRK